MSKALSPTLNMETPSIAPSSILPVRWVDPRDLSPHHLNRAMPRLSPGMPEWQALFDDIRDRGIQTPIQVVNGTKVVDGETRRLVAVAIPLATVPVVDVPEDQGVTTLVEHLCLQKHLTKGQRAYISYHLAKGLETESKARRMAKLKKGQSPMPIESASGNIGDFGTFCERFGFSRDLFEQARKLHAAFEADPSLREQFEPRILDLNEPHGLGAVWAGIAGKHSTEGREKQPNPEIALEDWTDGVQAIDKVARKWPRLRREARPEIVAAWTRVAVSWPRDLRLELAAALTRGLDGEEHGQ